MANSFNEEFSKFIGEERCLYAGDDDNRFAFSIGQAFQYYRYLILIKWRYEKESKEFIENTKEIQAAIPEGHSKQSPKLKVLHEKSNELQITLHLEIESFYLFGTIFVEKLGCFLEDYFGVIRYQRLNNHDRLFKNYKHFAQTKGIANSDSLLKLAKGIKKKLTVYRNRQITHHWDPKTIKGTSFSGTGETGIATIRLYPNEKELSEKQVETINLPDLLSLLEEYCKEILEIVIKNRNKSRFVLVK